MAIPSYSKIWSIGTRGTEEVLQGTVVVQEKVDGSQFSWRKLPTGEVEFRSKGALLVWGQQDKLFTKSMEHILSVSDKLTPDYIYRGEAISKPRHNAITYARVPAGNIVLFDVQVFPGDHRFMPPEQLRMEATRLGMEPVWSVSFDGADIASGGSENAWVRSTINDESQLGGSKREGVVIKNYDRIDRFGQILMVKVVRPEFKELHKVEWKKDNPTVESLTKGIVEAVASQARWDKTIQHLTEERRLEGSMRDLAALLPEFIRDIEVECKEYIKDQLFDYFWPHIKRMSVRGKPEWLKEKLAQQQQSPQPQE